MWTKIHSDLVRIADHLDRKGLYTEADRLTEIVKTAARGDGSVRRNFTDTGWILDFARFKRRIGPSFIDKKYGDKEKSFVAAERQRQRLAKLSRKEFLEYADTLQKASSGLKNISRRDKSWTVAIQRQNNTATHQFRDERYGGKEKALAMAIALRDKLSVMPIEEFAVYCEQRHEKVQTEPRGNNPYRNIQWKEPRHNTSPSWTVYFKNKDGEKKQKEFVVSHYDSKEDAFAAAVAFRRQWEVENYGKSILPAKEAPPERRQYKQYFERKRSTPTSTPFTGVCYIKSHNAYETLWNEDGNRRRQKFPLANYSSSEEALKDAVQLRISKELEYNVDATNNQKIYEEHFGESFHPRTKKLEDETEKLASIADQLDRKGFYAEADRLTRLLVAEDLDYHTRPETMTIDLYKNIYLYQMQNSKEQQDQRLSDEAQMQKLKAADYLSRAIPEYLSEIVVSLKAAFDRNVGLADAELSSPAEQMDHSIADLSYKQKMRQMLEYPEISRDARLPNYSVEPSFAKGQDQIRDWYYDFQERIAKSDTVDQWISTFNYIVQSLHSSGMLAQCVWHFMEDDEYPRMWDDSDIPDSLTEDKRPAWELEKENIEQDENPGYWTSKHDWKVRACKIADQLDRKGLYFEADRLTELIRTGGKAYTMYRGISVAPEEAKEILASKSYKHKAGWRADEIGLPADNIYVTPELDLAIM